MIRASAKVDELEHQIYPDGDGSEMVEVLRMKECRLKKLQEAREVLGREKLEKVNVTDPESRLMKDSRKVIQPSYNGQIAVDNKEQVIVAADEKSECHRSCRVQALSGTGRTKPWRSA